VSRSALVFWGTAVGVAVAFAAATAAFLPYEALRLATAAERERAWLLTVWTAGVFAILFGISAMLGAFGGIGFRDVMEAGSVRKATELHRQRGDPEAMAYTRRFDWWLVATGALLVGIYFAGWLGMR
jgi:hypothetical protein